MIKIREKWTETSIQDIMEYYVGGFELPPGLTIRSFDFFYDAAKGRVAFKIITQEGPTNDQA